MSSYVLIRICFAVTVIQRSLHVEHGLPHGTVHARSFAHAPTDTLEILFNSFIAVKPWLCTSQETALGTFIIP